MDDHQCPAVTNIPVEFLKLRFGSLRPVVNNDNGIVVVIISVPFAPVFQPPGYMIFHIGELKSAIHS
jgi:hypothetical protein